MRAAARAAAPYTSAGYATFVDGVVLPWALEIYREELAREGAEVRCAVLLPGVNEVVRRGLSRSEDHGLDEAVYREMHRQFIEAFDGNSEPIFRQATSVADTASSILAAYALEVAKHEAVDAHPLHAFRQPLGAAARRASF